MEEYEIENLIKEKIEERVGWEILKILIAIAIGFFISKAIS